MKTPLLLTIILSSISLSVNAMDWVNFIRQNQSDSGVIWDMPVDSQGKAPSMMALEEGGSLFQLWTIRQSDAADFLLDQKIVGAYLPAAEIQIETGDPYPLIHRTRVDQPFTVTVNVSGLLQGADIPDAAKRVIIEHHLASYAQGQSSIDSQLAIGGTPHTSGYISSNGPRQFRFQSTSLTATRPSEAMGEEHFVIHALPDESMPQSQIASDYVQVWPLANGSIRGITAGQLLRFSPPPIELHLERLYPSSTTYLQIYQGKPKLGVEGKVIEGSMLVLDQDSMEDRVIRIDEWQKYLVKDGHYTMEVITITPFGTERLYHLDFVVDRELTVNAQLGDIEFVNKSGTVGPINK